MLTKLADWNHRVIFTRYASLMSKISDATSFALSDVLLWTFLSPIFILALLGYGIYATLRDLSTITVQIQHPGPLTTGDVVQAGVVIALLFWIVCIFSLNYYRTSHLSTFGVAEAKNFAIDIDSEIMYVADKLKALPPPALSFADYTRQSIAAVHQFTVQQLGYDFHSTQRPKSSLFSHQLLRTSNAAAMYNPLFSEIVVHEARLWVAIPHEAFHSRGYMREDEVEFYTILVLTAASDPTLAYWGYFHWLTKLTQLKEWQDQSWYAEDYFALVNMPSHVTELFDELSSEEDSPSPILTIFHRAVMYLFNRKDAETAYVRLPAQYLAAHRLLHS